MKVLVAGDFAPTGRLKRQIENNTFDEIFPEDLRSIIHGADYSVINLESPVIRSHYQPLKKSGPSLGGPWGAMEAIKYAGFHAVTLANNHIMDYGVEGLNDTIACCNEHGVDYVGVGNSVLLSDEVLYYKHGNEVLAIINCCENEFSVAKRMSSGANPLDPVRQFYAIQKAKKISDYVLVIVHGGHELFQLPSLRMKETYHFFIDSGADAVVNHHQHCYSGFEVYNDKPIFYGIGNFAFDNQQIKNPIWNRGYMVELEFLSQNIKFKLYPYVQYDITPAVKLLNDNCKDFYERLTKFNNIILDDTILFEELSNYYKSCAEYERYILSPYSGRIFAKLFKYNLLPDFLKGKRKYRMQNHIECESHREKLIAMLSSIN